MHFPNLAPGGVTIAVTLNKVTGGREAAVKIVSEVLAQYGYAPVWTSLPMRVIMDLTKTYGPQVTKFFWSQIPGGASKLPSVCSRRASVRFCACARREQHVRTKSGDARSSATPSTQTQASIDEVRQRAKQKLKEAANVADVAFCKK